MTTYTIRNAAMTLGTAEAIWAARDRYEPSQVARAAAVVRYWKARRATAAKMKAARAAVTK